MRQVLLRDRQQDDQTTNRLGRLWNTGNYFFLDAVQNQIAFDEVRYSASESVSGDTLVLSMSNFISKNTDMTVFADYIERHDFSKVVMIGAGAQAADTDGRVTLTKGTDRFLRLISERSASIGVRGHYTAMVLESLGISNVRVIGCPTIFWSQKQDFRLDNPHDPSRISVNFTPNGKYRDKISLLLQEAAGAGAQYIAQDENFVEAVSDEAEERRSWTARYYGNSPAVRSLLDGERHFYSIPEWIEYMARFDFVVGTRFHGNMAALQAGIPALLMVCDSRTKELADFLNLPYRSFASYGGESLSQLAESVDFTLFNATYRAKFQNYLDFLDENGLRHNLSTGNQGSSNSDLLASMDGEYDRRSQAQLFRDGRMADVDPNRIGTEISVRSEHLRGPLVGAAAESGRFDAESSRAARTEMAALMSLATPTSVE